MTDTSATPSTPLTPLASAFDGADRESWRALVEKALKGADFEKRMVAKTTDGIRVEPIYARDKNQADDAAPGAAPFTRGTKDTVDGLGWHIHQIVTDADPQSANRIILEELEAGSNGIVLQVAGPGQHGVKLDSTSDVVTALTGAYLDYAPVQFKAGLNDVAAAKLLLSALDSLGTDPKNVCAHLNMDPVGNWSRHGHVEKGLDAALETATAVAKDARTRAPKLRTLHVDATIPHEAGASEGQELAYAASCLVTYLKAFENAGVAPADAFAQIAFTFATDDDIFTSLAKLRAARRIICRIGEAAGVNSETLQSLHITARTSERMFAKRDPWTNILRTTVACAAAAFAGTEAITVHPFTWALGQPDVFARRIARNTQIVCQEESSLGRVVDPAGGSWYIEKLSDDLAEVAWAKFQDIEREGGLVASLNAGSLQNAIADVRAQRDADIAKRKKALTGVSEFPILGEDGVKFEPWPETQSLTGTPEITPLAPHRFAEAFEALRDEADRMIQSNGQPPRVFLANIGPIAEHNTRSTWIKNLLAAGGIAVVSNDGFENAEAAVAAFKDSGTKSACICSSDTLYADHAAATAKALKAAGANLVLMAGNPGDSEADYKGAGVDQFLFAGLNIVTTLEDLLKKTGSA